MDGIALPTSDRRKRRLPVWVMLLAVVAAILVAVWLNSRASGGSVAITPASTYGSLRRMATIPVHQPARINAMLARQIS